MSRLSRPDGSEWGTTAWTVMESYKDYRCDDRGEEIPRGGSYVRTVAFPSHEAVTGTWPSVMRLCLNCAAGYGALPPTWAQRRAAS